MLTPATRAIGAVVDISPHRYSLVRIKQVCFRSLYIDASKPRPFAVDLENLTFDNRRCTCGVRGDAWINAFKRHWGEPNFFLTIASFKTVFSTYAP